MRRRQGAARTALAVLASFTVLASSAAPAANANVSSPPHDALWECIHGNPRYRHASGGEAGSWYDRDSGGNGHYGGLQMHPDWGYGTSYHASDNPPSVQKWAAERGYRASGYSRSWLIQQWGQTIGPCWQYT